MTPTVPRTTLLLLAFLFLSGASAFIVSPQCRMRSTSIPLSESTMNDGEAESDPEDQPIIAESTVRIDDGGSDLTNRFKYKVNALMGTYDPQVGDDNEEQDGNILNAMLTFPTRFTFNVVGRTSGDDSLKESYIEQVKKTVSSLSGDEEGYECQITPRGKSFTRVSIQVEVDSAGVVSTIYDELSNIDMTVMKY